MYEDISLVPKGQGFGRVEMLAVAEKLAIAQENYEPSTTLAL
jgi:hypothetical protein